MTCRAQSNQGGDRATWTGHPDFAVCTTGAVCASSRQENQSGLEVNGTRGNSIDLKIAMLRQNCGLKVPRNCLVYRKAQNGSLRFPELDLAPAAFLLQPGLMLCAPA